MARFGIMLEIKAQQNLRRMAQLQIIYFHLKLIQCSYCDWVIQTCCRRMIAVSTIL